MIHTRRNAATPKLILLALITTLLIACGGGGGGGDSSGDTTTQSDNLSLFPTENDVVPEVENVVEVELDDGSIINVSEGRILVVFSEDATKEDYDALVKFVASENAEIIGQITDQRCVLLQVDENSNIETLISTINELSYIEYATYDRIYEALISTEVPTIPPDMPQKEWIEDIELEKAWRFLKNHGFDLGNENIKLGIIDGGIGQQNAYFDKLDGKPRIKEVGTSYEIEDHGTAVAVIAAAESGKVVGVAPDTPILSAYHGQNSTSELRIAVENLVKSDAKIINSCNGIKTGSINSIKTYRWDIRKAVETCAKNDVLFVLAEGDLDSSDTLGKDNSYFTIIDTPKDILLLNRYSNYYDSNVIIVTGTWEPKKGEPEIHFQYGDVTTIAAPGANITFAKSDGTFSINRGIGTSFSTPMVSGTAALILSIDDTLKPKKIREIIRDSGTELDEYISFLNVYNALYYAYYENQNYDQDLDGDGVLDGTDNCTDTFNPYQEDSDGDGIGDACEMVQVAVDDYVWFGTDRVNKEDLAVTSVVPYPGEIKSVSVDDTHAWVLQKSSVDEDTCNIFKISKSDLTYETWYLPSDNYSSIAVDENKVYVTYQSDLRQFNDYVQSINKDSDSSNLSWDQEPLNHRPGALVVDQNYLWMIPISWSVDQSDSSQKRVTRSNKTSGATDYVDLDGEVRSITVDQQYAWVGIPNLNKIAKIDKESLAVQYIDVSNVYSSASSIFADQNFVWFTGCTSCQDATNRKRYIGKMRKSDNYTELIETDAWASSIIAHDNDYLWMYTGGKPAQISKSNNDFNLLADFVTFSKNNGDMTGYNYDLFFSNN